jgi:hypothetical protein
MAQAHHADLLAQPQDLDEETLEGIEVAVPKLTKLVVGGRDLRATGS